jgi:hypothetical protein
VTGTRAALATAAAVLAFLGSWTLLHQSFWGRHQLVDTPVYEQYGDAMAAGRVPYRDFAVEYPPGALVAFLAPELTAPRGDFGAYGHAFEKWMAGCGVALVLLVGLALHVLRVPLVRAAPALALAALSPLLLGNLMLSRFDLFPAALTAATLAALVAEWELAAALLLGLAVSVKLYPVVLLPVAAIWLWRREGRRHALRLVGVAAATAAAVFLPFVVLSPGGVAHSLGTQLGRPDQIESLPAAILLAAHHLGGLALQTSGSHGSLNLVGPAASALGVASTAVGVVSLLATWTSFARGPMNRTRLVTAAAASLAIVVAFSRVFSPQFMLWLVPAVALGADMLAVSVLASALVLTQLWFPDRYWLLALHQGALESWLVFARDVVVVALAALLVRTLLQDGRLRERRPAREAVEPIRREVEA